MTVPPGRIRPDSDLPRGLLDDWEPLGLSCDATPGPRDNGLAIEGHAGLPETTAYPPARTPEPGRGGSLRFLAEFSLGEPDESVPTIPRGARTGPDGQTVRRLDRTPIRMPIEATGDRVGGPRSGRLPCKSGVASWPPRSFPDAGDVIAGFRILQELGRGAFARVYLAEEIHLGGRPVAIKVSRAEGDEPRILGRLQHANIVPVHSVHDDPISGLRVLCMPYFGGANLAQVLDIAGAGESTAKTGHGLVDALDQISRQQPASASEFLHPASARPYSGRDDREPAPTIASTATEAGRCGGLSVGNGSVLGSGFRSLIGRFIGGAEMPPTRPGVPTPGDDSHQPARQFLRKATAVQAAAWIVARLAEGLDHAHSRGLFHRDLKPANILLAADGTPMLLDFNLAAEAQPSSADGEIGRAMLGGTLPYMAPEHLDAFNPLGSTPAAAVDERADIYALGLILFEVIAGAHPFPMPDPAHGRPPSEIIEPMIEARRRPPSLKARCPHVPWSLDALVKRCLEFDPGRRYARARDLAEDLRRFLEDRPMKYAPEPSLRERAAKFVRRNKALCSSTSIAMIAMVLILALGGGVAVVYSGMQGLVARFHRQAFEREFTEAQFLLNTAGASDRHLNAGLIKAGALLDRLDLSDDRRDPAVEWFGGLTEAEQDRLREHIVELTMLEARARVLLASRRGSEADRRAALLRAVARLDMAARVAGRVPAALYHERSRYLARLGEDALAVLDLRLAGLARPATAHDWTLLATTLMDAGDPAAAEDALRKALRLDCTSFWTWFILGHCHFAQGRFVEAAGDFSACAAIGSQFAWVHFNRGLALARAGQLDPARDAYDQALRIDPDFTEAMVNRALVELELDQLESALADLTMAIRLGRHDAAILAARGEALARLGRTDDARRQFDSLLSADADNAVVRVARGMTRIQTDPRGARDDFEHVLKRDANHAAAHYGLALLVRRDDPEDALRHLDIACESDPHLVDAVQLRALVRARLGDPAALDDVDRLLKIPTARRYYNAACAVAVYAERAGQPKQLSHAMELLTRAVALGFPTADIASDPDLAPLRKWPSFRRLLDRNARAGGAHPTR